MKKRGLRLNLICLMLILKKKIIFINIKTSGIGLIIKKGFIYHFVNNKLLVLVFLSNYALKKYFILSESLNYFYNLKGKCISPFLLNSKLNFLTEFFHNIKNLGSLRTLNYFSHSQALISIIRSPFVYKKSMEQFFYKKHTINYQTNSLTYNFFFYSYQYISLKKVLEKFLYIKLLCKITFNFN
jgi:hypothetical protein